MKSRFLLSCVALVLAAGCGEPAVVTTPVTHPANPEAAAAPETPRSQTLRMDSPASGANLADPAKALPPAEPAGHGHHHGAETQSPAAGTTEPAPAAAKLMYTCPMHPEINSDKPGKCPLCGMSLVKTTGGEAK